MAAVDQVTFRLERFGWSTPDRLELMGRWTGLDLIDPETPAIVASAADGEHRIDPLPDSVRFRREGRWSATFPWDLDAAGVTDIRLEMGDGIILDLPRPSMRRFGRPLLHARVSSGRAPVVAERPATDDDDAAGAPPAPPAPPAPDSDARAIAETSPLELHTALVQAREDLEEARADAEHAREEAALARHDAERERERRLGESSRMREALATARALAQEQVDDEREGAGALRAQLETVNNALAVERLTRSRLREEVDALHSELERATAHERGELERVGAELTATRQALADLEQSAQGRDQELQATQLSVQRSAEELAAARQLANEREESLAAAEEQVRDLQQQVTALSAGLRDRETRVAALEGESQRALEQLSAAREAAHRHDERLAAAAEEARRREDELERLRARVLEGQRLAGDVPRLQEELQAARRRSEELEPLRAALAESRTAYEDARAAAEQSRTAALDSRAAAERAEAEREALSARLAAVRTALDEPI